MNRNIHDVTQSRMRREIADPMIEITRALLGAIPGARMNLERARQEVAELVWPNNRHESFVRHQPIVVVLPQYESEGNRPPQ